MAAWTTPYYGVTHLDGLRRGVQISLTAHRHDLVTGYCRTLGGSLVSFPSCGNMEDAREQAIAYADANLLWDTATGRRAVSASKSNSSSDSDAAGGALESASSATAEAGDSATTARVRMICGHCGSEDVLRDAYAQWNTESQEWELSATFDNAVCNACDGETTIEEEEI